MQQQGSTSMPLVRCTVHGVLVKKHVASIHAGENVKMTLAWKMTARAHTQANEKFRQKSNFGDEHTALRSIEAV